MIFIEQYYCIIIMKECDPVKNNIILLLFQINKYEHWFLLSLVANKTM